MKDFLPDKQKHIYSKIMVLSFSIYKGQKIICKKNKKQSFKNIG